MPVMDYEDMWMKQQKQTATNALPVNQATLAADVLTPLGFDMNAYMMKKDAIEGSGVPNEVPEQVYNIFDEQSSNAATMFGSMHMLMNNNCVFLFTFNEIQMILLTH